MAHTGVLALLANMARFHTRGETFAGQIPVVARPATKWNRANEPVLVRRRSQLLI